MLLVGVLASVGRAQDLGITVTGTGSVSGRPEVVEIQAVVSGDGELAGDANVRYRDARRRAVEAIEAMKIPALSIESRGVTVSQPPTPGMQQQLVQGIVVADTSAPKMVVTEQLRLVLKGADKLPAAELLETLLRVLDVARDSGLVIGPANPGPGGQVPTGVGSAMITYRIADPTGLRDQAYKLAIEDARARASRLAELSGAKLGKILSIRDLEPVISPADRQVFSGQQSSMLGEIPVQVRLSVQFEIAK